MNGALDLGDGHMLRFTHWTPDRELNPQYDHLPDVERWGAIVSHPVGPKPASETGIHEGGITFDGPVQRELVPDQARWTVEQWEPLTVSPSLLCSCVDHGFIRGGRWVRA